MPQRTNDFQQLVLLIQQALAPEGATVTESAMVETSCGDSLREIDILLESSIGPYQIRIAVEAKRESRKMDSVRFEGAIGRYFVEGGVRVNKVVVVTHKGFTKPVRDRAKLLDVELVTLSEANAVDWTRLKPPDICLRSAVDLIEMEFNEEVCRHFGGVVPADAQVVCSCGWRHGPPSNYARHLFWNKVLRENRSELLHVDDEVTATHKERKIRVGIRPAPPHRIFLERGEHKIAVSEFSFKVRLYEAQNAPSFSGEIQFLHAPHVCRVEFTPPIDSSDGRELLDKSTVKCSCCGRDHGTVRKWARDLALTRFLNRNEDARQKLLSALQQSPTGEANLIMTWPVPSRLRVMLRENEYSPTSVEITIHAVAAKGALQHQQYELCRSDGTTSRVDSFDAIVGGKRLRLVMPDGVTSKKIVMRVDNATPSRKKNAKRKNLRKRRRQIDSRKTLKSDPIRKPKPNGSNDANRLG